MLHLITESSEPEMRNQENARKAVVELCSPFRNFKTCGAQLLLTCLLELSRC
jgi:hypothetical protein